MNRGRGREDGTGYRPVQTTTSCVLTRFRLRSPMSLFRLYRAYRRVKQESRGLSGLLVSAFLIEDLRTCYTLSIWRDANAILLFNSKVRAHVAAANRSFHEIEVDERGPQMWSAQFQLCAVSPHNLRWDGIGNIAEQADIEVDRRGDTRGTNACP